MASQDGLEPPTYGHSRMHSTVLPTELLTYLVHLAYAYVLLNIIFSSILTECLSLIVIL